jgi:signal transduction histidine kinase/CheY-like chemotaxis protein
LDVAVTLAIEALFVAVFGAAIWDYLAHKNPAGRDLALVLAGLAGLFVVALYRSLFGAPPAVLTVVSTVALLLQPFFTLWLVSHVRPVRRWQLGLLLGALIASAVPLFALGADRPPLAVLPVIVIFAAGELYCAILLGLEAVRRHGGSRSRLAIAAGSTALFGMAFLALAGGTLGSAVEEAARIAARVLALGAAIGYVAAFLPPAPVRRVWQGAGAFDLGRGIFEIADSPVRVIWEHLLDAALGVSGGSAGAVVVSTDGDRRTVAVRGLADADVGGISPRMLAAGTPVQLPIEAIVPADGRPADAHFVGVVPADGSDAERTVSVIVAASFRSLFWRDDAELIASLAGQAAILAERRDALARQEALTDELGRTVEALRDANRAKSDFLASMSHELRTPLSAIIGFSDLMRAEPADGDRRIVPTEWIEHISRGGQHLLSLINDVLDLAKVEAGRLELRRERFDLGQLIAEVASGLRPLADRKRIRITSDVGHTAVLDADRGRVRQILYNLLSNAIKFTSDDGQVGIATRDDDGGIEVAVSDTGVGIAAEDLDTVFQEFTQVGPADAQAGGTGLGLALTRRLVEAHDGSIRVESTVGSGSRFIVLLPSVAATEAPSPESPIVEPATVGQDVLVVEDDPSAARLLRQYLETAGYSVRVASDGESALSESLRRPPAAILLDLLLPGLDGWEVLRLLKADERLRDIPVIVVTVVDERDVGLALGAVDYFVKPIDRHALMTSLERLSLATKKNGPVRILAVDDDPAALDFIAATLEPEGIEVLRADGGSAAMALAASTPVDLVICDLVMPDMDGIEVVSALRKLEATKKTPIVISTAHPLTASDKQRLNGEILAVVEKGPGAQAGLRSWLDRVVARA